MRLDLPRSRSLLLVSASLFAIAAAGCGAGAATPAPSLLSDPNEIVVRSLARLGATTTVHVEAVLHGSVSAASLGTLSGGALSGLSGSVKLDGATMSGDVDMARGALHISASFSTFFGAAADVIVVDGSAYTKITTFASPKDEKYIASKLPALLPASSSAPQATLNPADLLGQLKARLDSAGATAILVGVDTVGGRSAYHIQENVPADLLNGAVESAAGGAGKGVVLDAAPVDYWVFVDSLQPSGLQVRVDAQGVGNVTMAMTLTRFDQPVAIQAPPGDQVAAG